MLGKYSLIVSSQGSPVIVETRFIFKYENKKKVTVTEEDKENINLFVQCPSLKDNPIQFIDSHDATKWLLTTYQPNIQKRIKIMKRFSETPKQKKKNTTFMGNSAKKKAAAQRKMAANQTKIVLQRADVFYKNCKNQGNSNNEISQSSSDDNIERTDNFQDGDMSSDHGSFIETSILPSNSPLTEGMPSSSPERRPSTQHTLSPNRSAFNTLNSTRAEVKKMKANRIFQCLTEMTNHLNQIDQRLGVVETRLANNNNNNNDNNHINNNNSTDNDRYNTRNCDENVDLVPDANREVEIIPGFKMDYTACVNACNATRMSTRAARVIRKLWPVDRRSQLILRENKERPGWEIADEADIVQAINVYMAMQKIHKLDNHRENSASLNMRKWLSNVVKNERSIKKRASKEHSLVIEQV